MNIIKSLQSLFSKKKKKNDEKELNPYFSEEDYRGLFSSFKYHLGCESDFNVGEKVNIIIYSNGLEYHTNGYIAMITIQRRYLRDITGLDESKLKNEDTIKNLMIFYSVRYLVLTYDGDNNIILLDSIKDTIKISKLSEKEKSEERKNIKKKINEMKKDIYTFCYIGCINSECQKDECPFYTYIADQTYGDKG